MADTTIKLSGTYDSIEAYRILEEMREINTDCEEIKTEAEAAVTTATAAAATAQEQANNANTYAYNAQTYAGNANTSAGDAAGYASSASTSATNAAISETNAATSETNASASATDAESAKDAAESVLQEIEDMRDYFGMPIGYEYFTFNPNIPQGSLPLFGGTYSRETYPDLWAWVQEQTGYLKTEAQWQALSSANGGNVPYYSDGDGSTTFRVPSLKCWVKGANGTVSEVGSYLAAGLPNITGDNRSYTFNNGASSGAFTHTITAKNVTMPKGTTVGYQTVSIDASRSNSIYGNSTTVQPPSIVGMWLVKAYGVVEETGTIDEQQYIDDRFAAAKDYTDMEVETGVPTGCVQAFAGQTTPTGWLLCDGSAVSRVTYAKLFAVIGTSYGSGDGSTTFALPDLVDKFVQGNATSGTVKSAGLPNITGAYTPRSNSSTSQVIIITDTSGAFRNSDSIVNYSVTANRTTDNVSYPFGVTFDASRSSSIYGNSTTVQPPALTMRYIIKY